MLPILYTHTKCMGVQNYRLHESVRNYQPVPYNMLQVHERVIADCVWESRLKSLNWRVDIQSKARHIDQLNQPSAIVELQLGPATSDKVRRVVSLIVSTVKPIYSEYLV